MRPADMRELARAVWDAEGLTGRPFIFVVERHDGTPIAAVPVIGGRWGKAEKWCYLTRQRDLCERGKR